MADKKRTMPPFLLLDFERTVELFGSVFSLHTARTCPALGANCIRGISNENALNCKTRSRHSFSFDKEGPSFSLLKVKVPVKTIHHFMCDCRS